MNLANLSNLINNLNNSPQDYLWALSTFAVTLIVFYLFRLLILKRLGKWADSSTNKIDNKLIEGIEGIGLLFYLIITLQISLQFINIPQSLEKPLYYITLIVVVYSLTKALDDFVASSVRSIARANNRDTEASIIQILIKASKGALWVISFLLVLSNLGYNISSLLAGVGISGIAIAFALRSILEDLFSAFTIYFDKPFEVGDFIVIGKDKGTVQSIGLKSTRLKTLEGEELVVSNRELTKARVHNYKRMEKRRRTLEFGVTYDTSTKTLEKIPEIVKEIINNTDNVDFDRVYFTEFGDSGLKFEAIYYVDSPEYKDALAAQQEINLKLHQKFNQENIEIAFPTQTIHLEQ